jgi:hypothetical protein
MTIEERAELYAADHAPSHYRGVELSTAIRAALVEIVRDAYLTGSAQAQADYVAHLREAYAAIPTDYVHVPRVDGRPSL